MVLTLFPSAPAAAQETPGYDPDTAGGVEYQLPLARTRREATGRQAEDPGAPKSKGAAKPIPLFGAGTGGGAASRPDDRPADETREDASASKRGESGSDGQPDARDSNEANGPGDRGPRTQKAASDSGGSGLQIGLTGGVLVVLLGAAVGVAARMRTRRGEPAG